MNDKALNGFVAVCLTILCTVSVVVGTALVIALMNPHSVLTPVPTVERTLTR